MNRIEIRGVIVPSDYDSSWFQSYIDRGIITPESRVRNALKAAEGDSVEVYVNSPGGSVFAGNEMINALVEWKGAKQGRSVTCTVGAMAASMGSAIVVSASDKVRVHRNAKLMFHGAQAVTVGGAQMHKDEAALLEKINADMKTQLVSRYGLKPEVVDEWFAEGREGWMSADEAKACGMAHEIIGEDAPAAAKVQFADIDALATKGMKIAACAAFDIEQIPQAPVAPPAEQESPYKSTQADAAVTLGEVAAPVDPVSQGAAVVAGQAHTPDAAGSIPAPATITDEALAMQAELEKLQARIKALEEEGATLKAESEKAKTEARAQQSAKDRAVAEAQKTITGLQAELAAAKKDFENTLSQKQKQNDELATRLNRLTVAALTPSPEVKSWAEAMQHCGGDYVKARRMFPDLFAQMMRQVKARK